jgi:hypothetical protein
LLTRIKARPGRGEKLFPGNPMEDALDHPLLLAFILTASILVGGVPAFASLQKARARRRRP